MYKFLHKFVTAFRLFFRWFDVAANRRKLYRLAQYAGLAAVSGGWITPAVDQKWLATASGLLLLYYGNLAESNAPDAIDSVAKTVKRL